MLKQVTEWALSNKVKESANQIQKWMKLRSHSENEQKRPYAPSPSNVSADPV